MWGGEYKRSAVCVDRMDESRVPAVRGRVDRDVLDMPEMRSYCVREGCGCADRWGWHADSVGCVRAAVSPEVVACLAGAAVGI